MIDQRSTKAYKLEKENKELKKEIERLNNITNEIRKIINIEKEKMGYAIYDSCLLLIENKINELKGINEPSFEEMVNFVENVCKDINRQSTLHEELEEERERIAKIVDDFKGSDK